MMNTYHQRLRAVTAERGNLCVGIDPHPGILTAWGLPLSASGLESMARTVVEALGETVAVFKPQAAFFEAYGSAGVAVLEQVIADVRAAGALSIVDAKRGDIGSTMDAYAQAYLGEGSPLAGDAVTLSPFLGFESLMPALERAVAFDRGVYVLARTSNPEGASVQLALGREGSVAQEIVDAATAFNQRNRTRAVGLVVGGTHASLGCDLDDFNASILVPGIGAQGGAVEDLPGVFGAACEYVLPMVGRGVLKAGPGHEDLRRAAQSYLAG